MGDVAGMRTELPLLFHITHEMLATEDAGLLHFIFVLKQIPMRIPPNHTAMIRTETSMSMSITQRETLATLVANATFNW